MKRNISAIIVKVCCTVLLIITVPSWSEAVDPAELKKDDRCAVCGMFVAKYRPWIAQIIFSDSSYAAFDGPKDMFKYYFQLNKYAPAKKHADIAAVYVTEYYSAKFMDAKKMFYVTGSNVLGPMGDELIPVATEAQAKEFLKDHKGKTILKFSEISMEHLLRSYEQ